MSQYEVHVLENGYNKQMSDTTIQANCTCTLIKGPNNIVVDTMTPWDKEKIIAGLNRCDLRCEDISHVICTHGHCDHIGNNHLFLNALHIVGFDICHKDKFTLHPFNNGLAYDIDDFVTVIPTVGHTQSHVSVIVHTSSNETIAIAGDLFESELDLQDSSIWLGAGSENPLKQQENRKKMLLLADWIIPGHGPKFRVTEEMKLEAGK